MSVVVQLRGDTAAEWLAVNPVLAKFEMAIEEETGRFKIGNGVTPFNDLPWSALSESIPDPLVFPVRTTDPETPLGGTLLAYSKRISGRSMLKTKTASGRDFPLQPSLFQNFIGALSTGATTTLTTLGMTATSVGTVSHPAVTSQYGFMANIASAVAALATAGTGSNVACMMRDLGLFFHCRIGLPQYSSDNRVFVGLASVTMASVVTDDDAALGHCMGFVASGPRGDVTWQAVCRDGSIIYLQDTGVPVLTGKVMDFYIYCSGPDDLTPHWRVDNVSDGTTTEGVFDRNLPGSSILMRPGIQISTVAGLAAVNIRMQRMYVESDR